MFWQSPPMQTHEGEISMSPRIKHLRTILASINEQLSQENLRPDARAYLEQTAEACRESIRSLAQRL